MNDYELVLKQTQAMTDELKAMNEQMIYNEWLWFWNKDLLIRANRRSGETWVMDKLKWVKLTEGL